MFDCAKERFPAQRLAVCVVHIILIAEGPEESGEIKSEVQRGSVELKVRFSVLFGSGFAH